MLLRFIERVESRIINFIYTYSIPAGHFCLQSDKIVLSCQFLWVSTQGPGLELFMPVRL